MSRIDDMARGLALRSDTTRASDSIRAEAADLPLERIARAAATPISRRRALRVVGGALVTAALPTSLVTPARAQVAHTAACTSCGVEHGAGCVGNFECGQEGYSDHPVCCRFPGYFGLLQTPYGGLCAQAGGGGNQPPGGAACCCPTGTSCGDPAVAACTCPDERQCPGVCCSANEVCIEPPGANEDQDLFCGPPCDCDHCWEGASQCCGCDELCCGTGCCGEGESCCDDSGGGLCCPSVDGYACSGEGDCGCLGFQQCGPKCCPLGTICGFRPTGTESYQCYGPWDLNPDAVRFWNPLLGAVLALGQASKRRHPVAAATGSADAIVAVAAVASLAALVRDRFRSSRPDSAYRRPVKVLKPRLAQLVPGPGLDPSAAQALDRLLAAEAGALVLLNAAAVARGRSLGGVRAGNMGAARSQARAYGGFAGRAGKALRELPALSTDAASALQAGGTAEVTVTVRQSREFLDSVQKGGLPAELRSRLSQLRLGRADQRRVARIILATRPGSGPVLLAPLTDASRLDAIRSLASLLRRAAARSRRRPLVRSKPGPGKVPGTRPHASISSQRRQRGSR